MATENSADQSGDIKRDIILAAVNSLDWSKFTSEEDMTRKVTRRAITISKMVQDKSYEMRVLDSVRIYADITECKFEPSSQRYMIYMTAVKNGSEEERIRTPRMDTYDGKIVRPMVDRLINALSEKPSVRGVVYKFNEPAPEGAKGPKVPSHGYRTCVWIDLF